jgi:RHH-type transcriptional regulator, proline utilization regulon repressor / proline dehydrogenase / delta 1-pyrroline-5-carboxylate dehydrogenase
MLFDRPIEPDPTKDAIHAAYRRDERAALLPLLDAAERSRAEGERVLARARARAARARELLQAGGGVEAFMQEYDLSSEEGVLLMCLAEALLRIPDSATQEALIRDKLARGAWSEHLGQSPSALVNASTWGLILSGRAVTLDPDAQGPAATLERLVARTGETIARVAIKQAMELLAEHFVAGATIEDALRRTRKHDAPRYSFDCLGEAARCARDVAFYFDAYQHAIGAVGASAPPTGSVFERPGVSVKLSALHPRYEYAQRSRVLAELTPRVAALAARARDADVGITLDAEEAERLDLSLDIFEAVYRDARFQAWEGLGFAVQAYQRRALPVLHWLATLAHAGRRRIPVRLVKGAYWDSEIKRAQQLGLDDYPVFTRKHATDVCYLGCARYLLANADAFYAQFATHNAYTVSYLLDTAGEHRNFEFQRLHGMGGTLYQALAEEGVAVACRVYAPVGSHEQLLPYLVRRLLENGANTSFVNQLADPRLPVERLVVDPVAALKAAEASPHPRIPAPIYIYGDERRNSRGLDLTDPDELARLDAALARAAGDPWIAAPVIGGTEASGRRLRATNPADETQTIGEVIEADAEQVRRAFATAAAAQPAWDETTAPERAQRLERAADLMEEQRADLMARVIREGGRTVADAVAEVREAVDACRYYALCARRDFAAGRALPGPTGESNRLYLRGRGVFACISPWNFPVAIFTGQVVAALAAGNAVIAKPARQTPLCAALVVRLLHEAGVPAEVLHFLPGGAGTLGDAMTSDPHLAGVALTGSTETAWRIHEKLARRRRPIVPFIAETGGQNALIADSSALPEQLIPDVFTSAFDSAGQRCSALRVLFIQREIAERVVQLLTEAMDELTIGDPMKLSTDIGPLIDRPAREDLMPHVERMRAEGRSLRELALPAGTERGSFFAPRVFEIDSLSRLTREVFGPVLHVIRYEAGKLDAVIDAVNATGYGLTLGVHSRIEATWERVRRRARVGNLYVNRNIIGAVVGVQPFGGEGLSGTGPKAGGPHYLHRFATERTMSINTAAIGGNAGLLSLDE